MTNMRDRRDAQATRARRDAVALDRIAALLRGDEGQELTDAELAGAIIDSVGLTGRITDSCGPDNAPGKNTRDRPGNRWRSALEAAEDFWASQDGDPAGQAERDRLMPQACTAGPAGEGCGGEVPRDGAEPDHLPGCPRFGPWRYIARFTPEAWQNNNAIEIDPLGAQEWDATAFATEITRDSNDVPGQHRLSYLVRWAKTGGEPGLDSPEGVLDNDDVFREDPAAPEWVRRHQGPFTIHVRRETRDATQDKQEK
jgi:hypothetical protein